MYKRRFVITGVQDDGSQPHTDGVYRPRLIPETATELITGGIAPWTLESNLDYQLCQIKLQLEKEKIFAEGAEKLFGRYKVLVVCDRGAMDNKAYMTETEFANVLRLLGRSETELRDGYDAVFHFVTAAKGAMDFYTTANNGARTETAEEATRADDRLISATTISEDTRTDRIKRLPKWIKL